jgi:outer membrane receptor for ferrienterochelin and colicins
LNGAKLRVFAGVKNIFNAYQDDFDYGIDRDPGYVYGPVEPRTFYVGLKIGNQL